MKAAIIAIGDEILIGQILDTNTYWLNQKLSDIGINTRVNISIGDDPEEIKASIDYAFKTCDIIFLTGGLGPTKDDKTKQVLVDYFDTTLVYNKKLYDRIEKLFNRLKIPMTENIFDQCHLPASAKLLTNNKGTAPGMLLEKHGKKLFSVPGVPYEMKDIFTNEIAKLITPEDNIQTHHWTIQTAGVSESIISEKLEVFESKLPKEVSLAYLPSIHSVRLRLSIKLSFNNAKDLYKILEKELSEILGDAIFATGEIPISKAVGELLAQKGKMVATAESCSGGYLAHLFTSLSGSSSYYEGSIIAYTNDIKKNILGVSPEILETVGAVSQETVEAMVKGLLPQLNVDYGLAISGVAGPTGGTEAKPVGTIWVAWGDKDNIQSQMITYSKDRMLNIKFASNFALNKLRLFLMG